MSCPDGYQGTAPRLGNRPHQLHPLLGQSTARSSERRAHRFQIRPSEHAARTPHEAWQLGAILTAAHRAAPARFLYPSQRLADHRQKSRCCPRIAPSDAHPARLESSCVTHAGLLRLKSHMRRPSQRTNYGRRPQWLQIHRRASTSSRRIAILAPCALKSHPSCIVRASGPAGAAGVSPSSRSSTSASRAGCAKCGCGRWCAATSSGGLRYIRTEKWLSPKRLWSAYFCRHAINQQYVTSLDRSTPKSLIGRRF